MLKGIDASEHNGTIDWNSAKNGLDFAMLRCGYGQDETDQDDTQFERNTNECKRLNIPYGVYIYSYALSVDRIYGEINHVLRLLKNKKPTYPIIIDMEDADNFKLKNGMPTSQTITEMIKTFCNAISRAGYKTGYYVNKDWYENHICADQLTQYLFWFARPGVNEPDLKCNIWQNQFGELGGLS